jgi:hypothetical protein
MGHTVPRDSARRAGMDRLRDLDAAVELNGDTPTLRLFALL